MESKDPRELLNFLGGWEGFEIDRWTINEELAPGPLGIALPSLTIELKPKDDFVKRCSRCGTPVEEVHDVVERRVRDMPFGPYDLWLIFPQSRLRCPRCGPTAEDIPWLDRYQRVRPGAHG
jgi:transposase